MALEPQRGVETLPAVGASACVDDDITECAMRDVALEVATKLPGLGAVSAVLLPKTP